MPCLSLTRLQQAGPDFEISLTTPRWATPSKPKAEANGPSSAAVGPATARRAAEAAERGVVYALQQRKVRAASEWFGAIADAVTQNGEAYPCMGTAVDEVLPLVTTQLVRSRDMPLPPQPTAAELEEARMLRYQYALLAMLIRVVGRHGGLGWDGAYVEGGGEDDFHGDSGLHFK